MKKSLRILGLSAAALILAASAAQAQGKGHDKDKGKDKDKEHGNAQAQRVDDDRVNNERRRDIIVRNGDVYRNGDVRVSKVPPGLAKKPGQMPPGQYKKRYGVTQGSSVLQQILGQRGYTVVRTQPYGESQYVYYRYRDGSVQRALVSPGNDRLSFGNVPASILQLVLAQLY